MAGAAIAVIATASAASAAEHSFTIPPQDLAEALRTFGVQSGVSISFRGEAVKAARSPGAVGAYEPQAALEHLLRGTGFSYVSAGAGFAIVPTPAPAARPSAQFVRIATAAQPPLPAASVEAPALAPRENSVEEVVVTGSRIVRNGFVTPAPVTALGQQQLLSRAPTNIPDALNQLPQFRGSLNNTQANAFGPGGVNQGNYLNLRGLGTQRSLILLDGVRAPATNGTGGVDINTLPQALVQRVDVVTGGASAAYGSDAVVGVVNFILDKKFTGAKATVQGGVSSRGDNQQYKVTAAVGGPFANGRGHAEASFDHFWQNGIDSNLDRPLGSVFAVAVGAGTAANPYVTYLDVRQLTISNAGVIRSGPLAGQQFNLGGTTTPVVAGSPTKDTATWGVGGNGGRYRSSSLTSTLRTDQLFGRASYELTPDLNAHFQASAARAFNGQFAINNQHLAGANTGITIFRDNAFLAPSTVVALGSAQSFTLSRLDDDIVIKTIRTRTESLTLNFGLDGRVGLLERDWRWDVNAVYGRSRLNQVSPDENNRRYYAAIDAVRDPSGNIVCRVTLTNPGLYPGCAPLNLFGTGASSQAARDYVTMIATQKIYNSTALASANLNGTLVDLPAGPLSVAFGGEHREVTLNQKTNTDPTAATLVDYTGIRGLPNNVTIANLATQGNARGRVNVTEGYAEADVPVLKDLPLVRSLDVNLAGRYTDYSTSGAVQTWKVGANYAPTEDIRIRGLISRDIAAPTLFQLFSSRTTGLAQVTDPHTNATSTYQTIGGGNSNLRPERASTFILGAVLTPRFVPGFTASVDYYNLNIKDAIGSLTAQQELINCENSNGTDPICAQIKRPLPFSDRTAANFPTSITVQNQNQASVRQSGIDVEAAYRFPVARFVGGVDGSLEFHTYLSFGLTNKSKQSDVSSVTTLLGATIYPKLAGSFDVSYAGGPLTFRVAERFTGKTRHSNTLVYTNYPDEPNVWYTDLDFTYDFAGISFLKGIGGEKLNKVAFLHIQNLFDAKPPLVPDNANPGLVMGTDRLKYDVIGANFIVGVRLRY